MPQTAVQQSATEALEAGVPSSAALLVRRGLQLWQRKQVVVSVVLLFVCTILVVLYRPTGTRPALRMRVQQQQQTGAPPPPPPPAAGTWSWAFNVSRPAMEACIRKVSAEPFWQEVQATYNGLPRLGIVIATDDKSVRMAGLGHMNAYAMRHRYVFHSALVNRAEWDRTEEDEPLHFFYTWRWRYIHKRMLGNYQWVLALDGDNFVLNMQNSLDKWLELHEDVVLHIRHDHEIASAAVMVRSTPFGYCFLEEWIKLGTVMETTRVNWDNGDIIDFIMDLAEPPFPECKPKRIVDYRNQYVPCLRQHYDRLLDLPQHLPIRILFPSQGFWRDYLGDTTFPELDNPAGQSDTFRRFYGTCAWPSDVFGHAWKTFDAHWPQDYLRDMSKNVSAHDTFPECDKHYTLEDELAMAQACCFTLYPGCAKPDGSNRCHGPHCPKNPLWWHPNCTSIPTMAAPLN